MMKNNIIQWAKDRNLIGGSTPQAQFVKTVEEVGELAYGLCRDDLVKIQDSIGDIYVTLVILAEQLGVDVDDCILMAWNGIKDRKGKMIDGVFVKEEDL